MENPNQIIKHEKRKGLIMLGVISLGLRVVGTGFYLAGMKFNTVVAKQSGIIMALMGVIPVPLSL
ncbi:hypothetical protein [Colwellia sp. C1TZA3]|uniref:hypothetical protein n=1 Tax=Colwellia sp. C1TZA3 TaxID=2508879 RepID=UPI0011B9F03E|nr:hypothetical protein [Colwellia sp. C1TZA3]TWX66527.1 hypothetical protein ESZ39_14155 [Colwellia sp. C1TZA3]